MQIKVAIVEDDEGIRSSLAALIRRAPNLKLVGDFPNAELAVKEIPARAPDVVMMDINLPGTAIRYSTPSRPAQAATCSSARRRRGSSRPSTTCMPAVRR
ncbi:MAG: response regulator [Verrucomicrobia bacterium]|nr:response regulator [Verrucomicrobiota bacterium]